MNVLCSLQQSREYGVVARYHDPSNIITDLFINPKEKTSISDMTVQLDKQIVIKFCHK